MPSGHGCPPSEPSSRAAVTAPTTRSRSSSHSTATSGVRVRGHQRGHCGAAGIRPDERRDTTPRRQPIRHRQPFQFLPHIDDVVLGHDQGMGRAARWMLRDQLLHELRTGHDRIRLPDGVNGRTCRQPVLGQLADCLLHVLLRRHEEVGLCQVGCEHDGAPRRSRRRHEPCATHDGPDRRPAFPAHHRQRYEAAAPQGQSRVASRHPSMFGGASPGNSGSNTRGYPLHGQRCYAERSVR